MTTREDNYQINYEFMEIYFYDFQVANMDQGTRTVLLEGDLESPRGIAVHPGVGGKKSF